MIRVLLLGATGQIGQALLGQLGSDFDLVAPGSSELNLSDFDAIRSQVRRIRPRLIINAAAYTAVDRAEDEPDLAMAVNGGAPGILAEAASEAGAALVHYSTDYVFDGASTIAYREADAPGPLNVYGRTKLAGDLAVQNSGVAHLIFRTAWVYGRHGHNFLLTMQRLLRERAEISVVGDQTGCPTSSVVIARNTVRILRAGSDDPVGFVRAHSGLYHLACAGQTSWFGFAEAIRARMLPGEPRLARLKQIPASEYPTGAQRPTHSVLDTSRMQRTFGIVLPDWETALDEVMS